MANVSMQIPTPPAKPDLEEIHRFCLSLQGWLRNMHLAGTQITMLSEVQVGELTGLQNAGKLYFQYDTTPQHLYCGYDNSGVLGLQEIF